ncbi:hypothetical protein Srubr_37320 [Streptomyces rubradiris]|uniref:Uncharacterized protein n=1 Tax=Streptomyces rubradiris TaxID=285531 RepID=A0ABQ3RDE1_STRRR|nr:hypothetical protein GCM10018792_06230 [Streptomyces rubradiris]GHI53886.1 hypothetical protein Srubr_37320 [Streptomyces rubradiris]
MIRAFIRDTVDRIRSAPTEVRRTRRDAGRGRYAADPSDSSAGWRLPGFAQSDRKHAPDRAGAAADHRLSGIGG